MINCEVKLILTWPKNCVITDMTTQAVGNPPATNPSINAPADATFKIDDAKVYVPTMMLKYMSLSQLRMITDYYNN